SSSPDARLHAGQASVQFSGFQGVRHLVIDTSYLGSGALRHRPPRGQDLDPEACSVRAPPCPDLSSQVTEKTRVFEVLFEVPDTSFSGREAPRHPAQEAARAAGGDRATPYPFDDVRGNEWTCILWTCCTTTTPRTAAGRRSSGATRPPTASSSSPWSRRAST